MVWKFQTEHVDTFYLTHATSQGTFLTSSVDGHHQVIEIDRACQLCLDIQKLSKALSSLLPFNQWIF